MQYLTWGQTGLRVSQLALGTVELGLDYGIAATGETLRPTYADAERLLHHALDAGINIIDTARAYGDAEAIIGRALARRRHQYILVTKTTTADPVASLTESLRHLRTDHVDVLLLHCRPGEIPHRDALPANLPARFIGASVYGPHVPPGFDCAQIAWNPLDRRPAHAAHHNNLGLMARSVLMRGALTFRHTHLPPALAPVRHAIQQLQSLGLPLPELAYRYILSQPQPVTALVGTARPAELDQCIDYAARGPLPPGILAAINQIHLDESFLDLSRWPAF